MAKQKDLVRIHVAAIYFAQESRDINKVAEAFNVSAQTIRRWSKEEPGWERALRLWESKDEASCCVDRTFETQPKRNAKRDTYELFKAAETEYKSAIKRGVASHKLASQTAKKVGKGLTRRRVYEWARLYNWIEQGKPQEDE